jgi:hypothetical protein
MAPPALVGLVCGLVTGLVVAKPRDGALVAPAVAGSLAALFVAGAGPGTAAPGATGLAEVVQVVLLAGAGAWIVSVTGRKTRALVIWLVLGTLVIGLWVATLSMNQASYPGRWPVARLLATEPTAGQYFFDGSTYVRIFYLTQHGMDYYQAFRKAVNEDGRGGGLPKSVLNYRLPTLFWSLLPLPADGRAAVFPLLVLASGALLGAYLLAATNVRSPIALLAPVLLWPYLLRPLTSTYLLFTEYWGAVLAVAAMGAAGLAVKRDRRWEPAAVGLAVLAALTRELFAYVLVAGLIARLTDKEERRRAAWWISGLALFAAGYALHYLAARRFAPSGMSWTLATWLHGGPQFLAGVLRFNQDYLAERAWTPLLLGAMGLAGAAAARPRPLRTLCLTAALMPTAAFLVVGSGPWGDYWGPVLTPLLLVMAPMALAWLPYGRRAASASSEHGLEPAEAPRPAAGG